jgi:multidrug efflux pump subunit AcrB
VNVSLQESSTAIRHEDQKRVITVTADVTEGGNAIELTDALRTKLESGEMQLPAGISYEFGGETEESNQAFMEMFLALVVGVMLMIAILVLQFDSYRHTAYVLSILPFSIIGILYGLAITGSALSFPSMLGFIALSGIVVNNSILLIDQMNHKRKETPEVPLRTIVVESAVSRLRPILLTTLTTVIGMVPLLFTEEIWIPLAAAIIFGLSFSVLITLILIPIIYLKYPGTVRSKF